MDPPGEYGDLRTADIGKAPGTKSTGKSGKYRYKYASS